MKHDAWMDAPVGDLDLKRIGEQLLKLPLLCHLLGHTNLEDSLRYAHAEKPEAVFVEDVLALAKGRGRGMSLEEFSDKWLGGTDGAIDLISAMYQADRTAHATAHDGATPTA